MTHYPLTGMSFIVWCDLLWVMLLDSCVRDMTCHTCRWVMSHINESCHVWMCHVTHGWVKQCHSQISHVAHWCVMSHIWCELFVSKWNCSTHECVTWLICVWHDSSMCDMTHLCVTWHIYVWHDSSMCDMTHLCVTWLINMRHDLFASDIARLIHVWHDSFIRDMTHLCVTWPIYVWHDSFTKCKLVMIYVLQGGEDS